MTNQIHPYGPTSCSRDPVAGNGRSAFQCFAALASHTYVSTRRRIVTTRHEPT